MTLLIMIGSIQTLGSHILNSVGNLILLENAIIVAGNIPKARVNSTIPKVGKNTNQDNR